MIMPLLSVVGSGYQHFENADLDLSAHKCYYITFFPKDYRELPLPSPLRPEALCQAKIYPRLIVGFVVAISLILTLSFLLAISHSFSLSHSLSLSLSFPRRRIFVDNPWVCRLFNRKFAWIPATSIKYNECPDVPQEPS